MAFLHYTPDSLYKQRFHSALKGYAPKDVDSFIDLVILDYKLFGKTINQLRITSDNLNNELRPTQKENKVLKTKLEKQTRAYQSPNNPLRKSLSQHIQLLNQARTKIKKMQLKIKELKSLPNNPFIRANISLNNENSKYYNQKKARNLHKKANRKTIKQSFHNWKRKQRNQPYLTKQDKKKLRQQVANTKPRGEVLWSRPNISRIKNRLTRLERQVYKHSKK